MHIRIDNLKGIKLIVDEVERIVQLCLKKKKGEKKDNFLSHAPLITCPFILTTG